MAKAIGLCTDHYNRCPAFQNNENFLLRDSRSEKPIGRNCGYWVTRFPSQSRKPRFDCISNSRIFNLQILLPPARNKYWPAIATTTDHRCPASTKTHIHKTACPDLISNRLPAAKKRFSHLLPPYECCPRDGIHIHIYLSSVMHISCWRSFSYIRDLPGTESLKFQTSDQNPRKDLQDRKQTSTAV